MLLSIILEKKEAIIMTYLDLVKKWFMVFLMWLEKYHKGILAAFAITLIISLIYGFMHPVDLSWISNPNFIRPGEDTGWAVQVGIMGWINSATTYWFLHIHYFIPCMLIGAFIEWLLGRKMN